MDDIIDSKIFLRDEAWSILKNKGYISYLPAPIPMDVIFTYEKIHLLNREIASVREHAQDPDLRKMREAKIEVHKRIVTLIEVLDRRYPAIGKHFKMEPAGGRAA
jgi:predicted RNA-binding protein